MINFTETKKDFPILARKIGGKSLIYLDNAATTQKPEVVIRAISDYYRNNNANVHRGVHRLSEEATEKYESARESVTKFINAGSSREVIFTRNATEAINLVAQSWGRANLKKGDEILLTELEHHSNIVPWQEISKQTGSTVLFAPIDSEGRLDIKRWESLLNKKTKIVGLTHMSNGLGVVNPVAELIAKAHGVGAVVLVDAAQSISGMPIDVSSLNVDFLAISGHKLYGPTGIGVLYGKERFLQAMDPFLTGGDMIKEVGKWGATWNDLPMKFEAGTPNISGAVGLAAATNYVKEIGLKAIWKHEQELTARALGLLAAIPGLTLYGPKDIDHRGGIISFNLDEIHAHDVASILDEDGIAVRSGHHCNQVLMNALNIPASVRASFAIYNTTEDVEKLVAGVEKVQSVLAKE